MRIKALTLKDLQNGDVQNAIIQIGSEFISEAGHPFPINQSHFFEFWLGLKYQDLAEFFIAENEGRIVGVFGALFFPEPFTGELQATESFWFVTKSARGSSAAIRLYQAFDKEATRRGCKTAMMVNIAGLGDGALEKFYTGQGYVKAEQAFRKVF